METKMQFKKVTSIREAYDDLFDLTSPNNKEEFYYHRAYQNLDPDKIIVILKKYIATLNEWNCSMQQWAFFKHGVYESYGYDSPFTTLVLWPPKTDGERLRFVVDLDWEKVHDSQMEKKERARLGYILYFMLANGECMQNDRDTRLTYDIHQLVPAFHLSF
jgi:hypothetical protein